MCMYIYIYTKSSYFCIRYIYIYWYMSSLWMLERLELENLCHLPICSSVLGLRFKGLGSEREVFCIFSGVLHPIAPKIGNPKRKLIFQPWFFKGYVKFRGCIWWFVWEVVWWFFRCFFWLKKNFQDVKNSRVCFKKRASLETHISKMGSTVGPCVFSAISAVLNTQVVRWDCIGRCKVFWGNVGFAVGARRGVLVWFLLDDGIFVSTP